MQQDLAETIALSALGWLAGDDERLGHFMGATGTSAGDMKAGAADPDFLSSVLDFVAMDDAWVVAFCDANQLPYDAVLAARTALSGGAAPHWT